MDLLQEYKELYYKELEFQESLDNKITTGTTFLTILGSGQILLWSQIKNFQLTWYTGFYMALCLMSTIACIVAIILFYKTYAGYPIRRFPIKDMYIKQNEVLSTVQSDETNIAIQHITLAMTERFANDAIHNREQNQIKSKRYKRFICSVGLAFIVTFVTLMCNVAIDYYETSIKEVTVTMADEDIKLNITLPEMHDKTGKPIKMTTPLPETIQATFDLHRDDQTVQKNDDK